MAARIAASPGGLGCAAQGSARGLHHLGAVRAEPAPGRRQYDAVDPANRLVAAELERRWNEALQAVCGLEGEITALAAKRPLPLGEKAAGSGLMHSARRKSSAETTSSPELADRATLRVVKKGETLIEQGASDNNLFFLISGILGRRRQRPPRRQARPRRPCRRDGRRPARPAALRHRDCRRGRGRRPACRS
jgi:hypothetical protein